MSEPVKLILEMHQAPGDCLMMTAAIRDLHKAHPGKFITDVKTTSPELWENNPYIRAVNRTKKDVKFIEMHYPEINAAKQSYLTGRVHFIHAYHLFLEEQLKVNIPLTVFKGDLHLSPTELSKPRFIGKPYWIINAGGKNDFTCKIWEHTRFQTIVDCLPEITFVQIGRAKHIHKALEGQNIINLIDKTNIRELIQIMRYASGVITGVSFPMHLCAAVDFPREYSWRAHRPCIVIAGNRENRNWEQYPWHTYLCKDNMYSCASSGACWKSRVEKLNDGLIQDASLCEQVFKTSSGQVIPKCLADISVEEVVEKVKEYESKKS